jgi:hypothetical protein
MLDSLVIIYKTYTHNVWLYIRLLIQKRNAVVLIAGILVRIVKSMAMTGHTHRTENHDK